MDIPEKIFVAGIDTDAGKSFVSAILTLGLNASYWKPVQAGTAPETDSQLVRRLTGLPPERFFPEAYCLQIPASPHHAAREEGIAIQAERLAPPAHRGRLVIEGAGGLMVPLRDDYLFIDWLAEWRIPTVLVARTYLGSINHSILSIEALESRGIPLLGIVFNEGGRPESEGAIARRAGGKVIGHVPHIAEPSPADLLALFHSQFRFPTQQAQA